jgi:hypothetical protein
MGVVATPAFYLAGALLSGGGYSFVSMMLFFPFGAFLDLGVSQSSWIFFPSVWVQFPVYGIILALAAKRHLLRRAAIILLIVHSLAFVVCLIVLPWSTFEKFDGGSATTGYRLRASKLFPA